MNQNSTRKGIPCDSVKDEDALGEVVEQDYDRAERLYRRGCRGNIAIGCADLGLLYERGLGRQADPERAAELYRRACDKGYIISCDELGILHESGYGVRRNYSRAQGYFVRSCNEGLQSGCEHAINGN